MMAFVILYDMINIWSLMQGTNGLESHETYFNLKFKFDWTSWMGIEGCKFVLNLQTFIEM
jgi:hypothetical protein